MIGVGQLWRSKDVKNTVVLYHLIIPHLTISTFDLLLIQVTYNQYL